MSRLDRRLAPRLSSSRGLLDLFTAALNGADACRTYAPYIRAQRVWRAAMFNALKSSIAEVAGAEAPARGFGDEDYRLAAVALLIHVANVDGETDLAERRRLKTIIAERFGLDANVASELITMGEESDREAVDCYHF